MNYRQLLNFAFLTPVASSLLLFCTGCLSQWVGGTPSAADATGHPHKTATINTKEKRPAKAKKKESLVKLEKEGRDENNRALLVKVTNQLRVGKNVSTSVTGKDLSGEICFVKFDTLPTTQQQEKFQITISEMVQGQEIALSFALFASELADKENSAISQSTVSADKIFIEQDESVGDGTTHSKKLSVEIQSQERGQFVIDQTTPEAPFSKSCTVALMSRS